MEKSPRQQPRRPIALTLIGLMLLSIAGYLTVDLFADRITLRLDDDSLIRSRILADDGRIEGEKGTESTKTKTEKSPEELRRLWYLKRRESPVYQDLAGWISIPELKIESPLFSRPGDYWYYTKTNRFGKPSADGEAGILIGNRNTIVWDHSFLDGTRFSKLADWPDEPTSIQEIEVDLETSDGITRHYKLLKTDYAYDSEFFRWDFPTEAHWEAYLKEVVGLPDDTKPDRLLTVYTCHTLDASVKSVLWLAEITP